MYSSPHKLNKVLSSTKIRKTFIEYLVNNHDHKFVPSSPVVPFCDPTVAFVNAGMNQFKSIFLGNVNPPHKRVANSQKCIRVGGKHNDLSVVGQDGYHHTFFEMLGNWSFGDYFKREACEMALDLLRGPYGVDSSRLYFTYFAGDSKLGIPADIECFEIWRSLGFSKDRILPFGYKENFWEMGTTGPCGPCTEIHIDHRLKDSSHKNRGHLVNAGLPDVTELWNIVFIEYKRNEDGTLEQLPQKHVDTGMGFERLTAVLQDRSSNYDTDIFLPIIKATEEHCKTRPYAGLFPTSSNDQILDTAYRILADHSRMVTVCISDGMLPDQNQKLRRVLRRAISTSENVFKNPKLLPSLIPIVAESLESAYPEIGTRLNDVLEVVNHEQEVFNMVRNSSSKAFVEILQHYPHLEVLDLIDLPGFVPAFKALQAEKASFKNGIIPGKFLFKLTDTYGLPEESFQKLAEVEGLKADEDGYRNEMSRAKLRARSQYNGYGSNESLNKFAQTLRRTDNNPKYIYEFDDKQYLYVVPSLSCIVTGLIRNGQPTNKINITSPSEATFGVVTDKSNFYYESGGQQADKGYISTANSIFKVKNVLNINGCLVHMIDLESASSLGTLSLGDIVTLDIDSECRTQNTLHHTAVHLLNGAVRSLYKKVTYQVSSSVTQDNLKLELGIIGQTIGPHEIQQIESLIRRLINSSASTKVSIVDAPDVMNKPHITTIPGEIYPETGLRLITIEEGALRFMSSELCCGTHVHNVSELKNFVITNLKQTNRARYAFTAVAGQAADDAINDAKQIESRITRLEEDFKTNTDRLYTTEIELQKIRNNLSHTNTVLPHTFKVDTLNRINRILWHLKKISRTSLKTFVEDEIRSFLQDKSLAKYPYIVHYLSSSALLDEVPLEKATNLCTDRPILVVSMCHSMVKARCCVPKSCITKTFNAQTWLKTFAAVFEGQLTSSKGQDPEQICNMKGRKVLSEFEEKLEVAMKACNDFACLELPGHRDPS